MVGVGGLFEIGDEGGRREDDVAGGEDDAAASFLDCFTLDLKARIGVGFVFLAFDVDIGLKVLKEVESGWIVVDVDKINAVQGGEVVGAEFFGDEGAACAFGDAGIGGEADEERVAQGAGLAEVADVTGVDDIKAPVTLDELHAISAHRLAHCKELLKGEDLDLRGRGHVCM